MNQQVKFNLLALLTIAVWGVTFVSTKILLSDGMTPTWVFISRFAIAYVCVLALSHKRLWTDSLRDEMYML
ncbi:MAG: EamA/RhaT family transporter, partial [Duncaniella sp.]|nr:EamA/RhaT family transporter [Duncaniella sp.]